MLRIYRSENYEAMSRRTAGILAAQVISNPAGVLGLATGSTPVGAYRYLVDWYRQGDLSFAETRSVNLDEYRGLAPDHDQSYRYFMGQNLFDHVDILPENTYVPRGLATDTEAECARYDKLIRDLGGVDLQLLGLGHNGHIGFNEPESCFSVGTNVVNLTESTIRANTRFFAEKGDVPRQALTMGVGTIMNARRILVSVSGAEKADVVCRAFSGPVTPQVPASILQLHPCVTLVGDREALSLLAATGAEIFG